MHVQSTMHKVNSWQLSHWLSQFTVTVLTPIQLECSYDTKPTGSHTTNSMTYS